MTTQVIKVGGAALNDAEWLSRFAQTAAVPAAGVARVLVHGGGPEISALAAEMGLRSEWHEGRRITSEPLLDVTSMVLTGRINKRIVRALCREGVDAIGLSGEDAGLVQGGLVASGALGRVGEVVKVRIELIRKLLELGLLPVLSPVSLAEDGGALNINADEVATSIAAQLEADELLFLTDVEGVRVQGARAESVSVSAVHQLIADQIATGGMALKLRAAVQALHAGVARVRVGPLEMLWDSNAGTVVTTEELACR